LKKINIAKNHIDFAYPNYKEAQDKIKNVDETNVPVEYQSTFSEFKSIYGAFVNDMEKYVRNSRRSWISDGLRKF